MWQIAQAPQAEPAEQSDGRACGLGFAAQLGLEDTTQMHAILDRIVLPAYAANGRTGRPRRRDGEDGSISGRTSTAALRDTQGCGPAAVECAEGDGTTGVKCADGYGAAAREAQGEDSLRDGMAADRPQPSVGSNTAALEPDGINGGGSKPPAAAVAAAALKTTRRGRAADRGLAATAANTEAAASEAPWWAAARLPVQGRQAHELVCSRCRTPHETQLAPFFVLPLGA